MFNPHLHTSLYLELPLVSKFPQHTHHHLVLAGAWKESPSHLLKACYCVSVKPLPKVVS